ncbi:FHA domain-containing protein [Paraburkholderia sp. DHOC27]|uniref:FHA domain-containing protein n=1 Tax=Paraburkholderia sp. DHOC27 TaxID=2303330 RepID=UPI000E3C7C08|nr:FHA domain-containing protein [Paraburkholderia sp. DHOC27]RFU47945.1 FHA domain-containing protein [Paraburkholderia sp. DHOC27]
MNPGEAPIAELRVTHEQAFDVVLLPVSQPELGAIRIGNTLFAVGRGEPPFASFPQESVSALSRRHARVFIEHGAAYVADLGSKNGTSVNGVSVRQTPHRLRVGDELCFGGALCYRVGIEPRAHDVGRPIQTVTLTLVPEREDLGLQPIEILSFPFLVSKTDELFSRYRAAFPHQVNYISRRHAHIFLQDGVPSIEDLGSTNGTFVAGKRLEESAVSLKDGDVLAFGGDHFVYKVHLHKACDLEATVTTIPASDPVKVEVFDTDKTAFVGAAHSFLEIFCIDQVTQRDDEVNESVAHATPAAERDTEHAPARRRWQVFAAELLRAFSGDDRTALRRGALWGVAGLMLVLAVSVALYMRGAAQREVKTLLADGDYGQATTLANENLARHPADTPMQALASEALLKSVVPDWLSALRRGNFARAAAVNARATALAAPNPDARPLVAELAWVGDLERFVVGRGGTQAPIHMNADEDVITNLLARWNADPQAHQHALDRISSYVPDFAEPYAQAMSHLRALQSDNSVYLPAIARLNAALKSDLPRGDFDALRAMLSEYAEKYPRLAGLEQLRTDLRQYVALADAARARQLGALLALMKSAHFATPQFQQQYQQFAATQLPSSAVMQQYQRAAAAWQRGDAQQALAGLQSMPASPWSDVLAQERARKQSVLDQYSALQKARGTKGYDDQLLTFYGALDPVADTWFVQAIGNDVAAIREKALVRAQDWLTHAQALWHQYRENGAIGGAERLESGISPQFRSQARLLSEAQSVAQQGMRIYTQLRADHPGDSDTLLNAINAEVDLQRRSLQELRMVLDPELLRAKLTLIGGAASEAGTAS